MTVNRAWVQQVKDVLAEIKPVGQQESPEAKARSAFQVFEFNSAPILVAEQTPEARATREINRISLWYGFDGEVTRALDAWGVATLASLDAEQLEQLVDHMRRLEDCRQNGGDSPFAPAAR